MTVTNSHFKFRRHDSIGTADAESDAEFLNACFVDTGDLETLRDCNSPQRLVVGRTGAGKSALLRGLKNCEDHVIELSPEALSLNYLTNSTIITFFENLGVQLDPFYALLWRHVFAVELIKHKFEIQNEKKKGEFLAWLADVLQRDKSKQKALRYLENWGSHFWEETEYRIKEFTTKLERELTASLEGTPFAARIGADGREMFSEEEKREIVQRAQKIVSDVQIKDLHEVIRLLSEDVFDDPMEKFFLVIDRLDENWVDERIRYKLLRALLEAVRAFQQIKFVKVIVALRTDLIDRVFRYTRNAGFQEEKYESLYLRLRWSAKQLETLLDKRVNRLIRRQYTGDDVRIRDILPATRKRVDALGYVMDRTFLRPREAILFVNECLAKAEGKAQITWTLIQSAEIEYSRKRLRSLADEWHSDFPSLPKNTRLLVKRRSPFFYKNLTKEDADDFALYMIGEGLEPKDPICGAVEQYMSGGISADGLFEVTLKALYQTGIIGFKPDAVTAVQWSYLNQPTITTGQIQLDAHFYVHPTFWSVLGTLRD